MSQKTTTTPEPQTCTCVSLATRCHHPHILIPPTSPHEKGDYPLTTPPQYLTLSGVSYSVEVVSCPPPISGSYCATPFIHKMSHTVHCTYTKKASTESINHHHILGYLTCDVQVAHTQQHMHSHTINNCTVTNLYGISQKFVLHASTGVLYGNDGMFFAL